MKLYIDKKYFNILDKFYSDSKQNNNLDNLDAATSFIKLFTNCRIFTNYTKKEIENIFKNNSQTFFEKVLLAKIKQSINDIRIEVDFNLKNEQLFENSYHFYPKTRLIESKIGKAIKGKNLHPIPFYNKYNQTIINFNTNEFLEEASKIVPPCNSLIIHDPYFLNPYGRKKEFTIQFIRMFSSRLVDLNERFQLTVFTERNENNLQPNNNQIIEFLDELREFNIEAQVIISNTKISSDRFCFTNYTYILLTHPYDHNPSDFSQTVMGLGDSFQNVIRNEEQFKNKLKMLKQHFEEQILIPNMFYTNCENFTNRIFQHLEKDPI